GYRAFVLERADDLALTAATGAGTISTSGAARIRGKLADGRSFSTSTTLAKNGDCPLYLSFNHGTEVVIGWLNFPSGPTPAADGTVFWMKSGTNGFAATLRATSASK